MKRKQPFTDNCQRNIPQGKFCSGTGYSRNNLHGILCCALLKSVDLAVAYIIVIVGQGLLAIADISPAVAGILLAVEGQGRGKCQRQSLADFAWVELGVHVKGESEGGIGRVTGQTGHTVIFLGVDRGDSEGIFEEERVGHDGNAIARGRRFRGVGKTRERGANKFLVFKLPELRNQTG